MEYAFRKRQAKQLLDKLNETIAVISERMERRQQGLDRLVFKQQQYQTFLKEKQNEWKIFVDQSVRHQAEFGRNQFAPLVCY